jgi:very-short-patch-repair endonuclease
LRGEGWERVIKSMAKGLMHLAKGFRKRSTDVEQLLWSRLRAGRFEGMKFRRQHPIGQYIADEVLTNTSGVLEAIRERLHRTPSPQSPPLKGGDVINHTK